MQNKTNISELAQFFPGSTPVSRSKTVTVRGVASRFWLPGDTYEQALARQAEARAHLDAKIAARKLAAAVTI